MSKHNCDDNRNDLFRPPSLPHIVRQQVEEGWKSFAENKFLTVSIPNSYKQDSQGLGPKPFPKLANLFGEESTVKVVTNTELQISDGSPQHFLEKSQSLKSTINSPTNAQSRGSHYSTTPPHRNRSNRAQSQQSHSQPRSPNNQKTSSQYDQESHLRPTSAPPPNTTSFNCKQILHKVSTPRRRKNLQMSQTDIQTIPDEFDDTTYRKHSSRTPPLSDESNQSINEIGNLNGGKCGSGNSITSDYSDSFLSNSKAFESPNSLLKAIDEHERNKSLEHVKSQRASEEHSEPDPTHLMNTGIHLLQAGKNIMEKSKRASTEQTETLTEVVEKLHCLVEGHLQGLHEENEILRQENSVLKDQLMKNTLDNACTHNNGTSLPSLITMQTATGERIPSCSSVNKSSHAFQRFSYTNSPIFSQYQSHREESKKSEKIANENKTIPLGPAENRNSTDGSLSSLRSRPVSACNKGASDPDSELLRRLKALEDTVFHIMKSSSEQTTRVQDRLYQQELRYEETLNKFEEVISSLTVMFTALQNQVAAQQPGPGHINATAAAAQLTQVAENLAAITKNSKRVQFRGILKPEAPEEEDHTLERV